MNGRRGLERELGGPPPPGVAALDDSQLEILAEAIRRVRHRQAAELEAAGDKALALIPRVLRGPVRRMAGS